MSKRQVLERIQQIKKALDPKVFELQKKIRNNYGISIDIDDYPRLKAVANVILQSNLPDWHIKKNPDIKHINIEDNDSFYSKHNRKTKTITLSNQLFSPEFRKIHPFHRIKHVPSFYELLIHEIGHAVDQRRDENDMENFYKHFGWAIANNKNGHKKLRNQGFKYALNSFREIPRERLTTVEDDDVKFIESRIKHEGFYQKPDKRMKISWYGVTSPREDFAESYVNYVLNPTLFRKLEPERFEFLKNHIFRGKEFVDYEVKNSIERMKSLLSKNYNNTLYVDSTLEEPYGVIPGTKEELDRNLELKEKLKRIKKCLIKKK